MKDSHSHHEFDNPEMFAKMFDANERDLWQKPNEVIESLGLKDNDVVVEIGAGTGYFTIKLAEYLKQGTVISFDKSRKMVEYLRKRVSDLSFSNVDVRHLEDGRMDLKEKTALIMCVDVYHHIGERILFFSSLKQYLNSDGLIVIIDRPVNSPVSPPHGHQTPPELVKQEMEQAGFKLVDVFDFLQPYQFYLAFKKAN